MKQPEVVNGAASDEELVARCRAGNMAAFGVLIERHQQRLFNAIIRVVGHHDDALELTQDAFVRALQGLKRFRSQSSFYTWLFRIGINLSINHRRRQSRRPTYSMHPASEQIGGQAASLVQLTDPDAAAPPRQAALNEQYRRTLAALEELEPDARAVVVLRDIEDMDYARIAQVLEVPVGTVKSRLSRARMTLREMLTEQDENAPRRRSTSS